MIYDADLITLGSNINPQPLVKGYSFNNSQPNVKD